MRERCEVIRTRDRDKPEVNLNWLAELKPIDKEMLEPGDSNKWEGYLQEVEVEPGACVLIAYNNGDVDAIVTTTNKWDEAIRELCAWLDEYPSFEGKKHEIFWKFGGAGRVRRYSRNY